MNSITRIFKDGWRYERREMLLGLALLAVLLAAVAMSIVCSVKMWQTGDETSRLFVVGIWAFNIGRMWSR